MTEPMPIRDAATVIVLDRNAALADHVLSLALGRELEPLLRVAATRALREAAGTEYAHLVPEFDEQDDDPEDAEDAADPGQSGGGDRQQHPGGEQRRRGDAVGQTERLVVAQRGRRADPDEAVARQLSGRRGDPDTADEQREHKQDHGDNRHNRPG